MKYFSILMLFFLITSCKEEKPVSSLDPINWEKRMIAVIPSDSMVVGTSYLSVYSEIYSQTEHTTHDLTATVSMRNTSRQDSIFIDSAQYYDTDGKLIRTYFEKTIYILPMETVEIVINGDDQDGGSGANFIFDWRTRHDSNEPLFEGVMISTSGQQGLSFTTLAKRIK